MPASSGRSTSSRRSTQTSSSSSEYHHHHRRDKTKSSQSYLQHRQQDSLAQARHAPQTSDAAPASPARPFPKGRAYSAPIVPKSQFAGPGENLQDPRRQQQPATNSVQDEEEDDDDEDKENDDESDDDDEIVHQEIVDDPFFQRLNAKSEQRTSEEEARSADSRDGSTDTECPLSPTSTQMKPRPDSTAEPLGSPLTPRSPVLWPENSTRMQEINIAVLGARSVGKSAFVQRAFDLRTPPPSPFTFRKMSIDGNVYVVRLIEFTYDDLDFDEERRVCWPDALAGTPVPIIDGAFTLYDVMNKDSLARVPESLSGIYNASVPFILVACKCDHPPSRRLVDPAVVDQRAKAMIGDVTAFQTSYSAPDSQKRCVAILLRAIVSVRNQHLHLAAARRRAHSSAVRHVSRPSVPNRHTRANSEHSGSMIRTQMGSADGQQQEHQPSTTPLQRTNAQQEPAESPRKGYNEPDNNAAESGAGVHEKMPSPQYPQQSPPAALMKTPTQNHPGHGWTFEELVERLLSQQISKQSSRFVTVFLVYYRKFASPGELLDVILDRFETVSQDMSPHMTKAQAQLRYLNILDSWISHYPGDFAYPTTRKELDRFITRIAPVRLFSVAAREIRANLDSVVEDDDTDWGFCDRIREMNLANSGHSLEKSVVGLAITSDDTPPQSPSTSRSGSISTVVSSSQALLDKVETAGRLARALVPAPRYVLTKMQWRALMDTPEEAIAKEMTRIDWIMFSSIRPRDLVRHIASSAAARSKYRCLNNVQRIIDHFNHIAHWVANFVLLRDKPKHRALMLEKFMKIARELRKLNNYNALGAVLAAFYSTPIHRLQLSRDLVPPAISKDFMKLEILMSSQKSHFAYRLAWENTMCERIPYLPLHRRDLVSARVGNSTFVGIDDEFQESLWLKGIADKRTLINWRKFDIMGDIMISIQRAQGQPYPLAAFGKNDEVRSLIMDTEIIADEDILYNRSLAIEPAGAATSKRRFQWFQSSAGVTATH